MNSYTYAMVCVLLFCFGCKARNDDVETHAVSFSARQLAERELEMDLTGHALFEKCDYRSSQYSFPGGASDGCALLVLGIPKCFAVPLASGDQAEAVDAVKAGLADSSLSKTGKPD